MGKKTRQRDEARERFWRTAISKRERSGSTVRAFCRREGLAVSTYHFWRRKLLKRDRGGVRSSSARRRTVKADVESRPMPTFASLTLGDASPQIPQISSMDASMPIEIVLRDNVRVRVGRGVDLHTLDQVLRVMEQRAC